MAADPRRIDPIARAWCVAGAVLLAAAVLAPGALAHLERGVAGLAGLAAALVLGPGLLALSVLGLIDLVRAGPEAPARRRREDAAIGVVCGAVGLAVTMTAF